MSLYIQQFGAGPDIVLLHGWGLHGDVFKALAWQLVNDYRVTLIDLPGHGRSPTSSHPQDLAAFARQVAAAAPATAAWLGWSLGGMIATQVALDTPEQVEKLILVTSSPRFVTAEDWPYAMDPATLAGFARALHEDYRETLDRFLALQAAPGAAGRDTLRQLRETLLRFPPPGSRALDDGLAILRSADLRARLPALRCPVLSIFGQHDRLVPAAVAPAVAALLPTSQIEIIKGSGHAPFISHSQTFIARLSAFLENTHG